MSIAIALLCAAGLSKGTQQQDLYPKIRALILEAEAASVHVQSWKDKSDPAEWAGHLYARAGYFRDAERAFNRSSRFPFALLKAYVLYGEVDTADKLLACAPNYTAKANAQMAVADVFWRMGESRRAVAYAEGAVASANLVTDPAHKRNLLESGRQAAQYMSGSAPNTLSPTPKPPAWMAATESPFPHFPITPDGLGNKTREEIAQRAETNRKLLEELYTKTIAGDEEGLQQIAATIKTPFQKALVLASIEHFSIQSDRPEQAEQIAIRLPEADDECILAKAEAISASAAAFSKAGDTDHANAGFAAAKELVQSAVRTPIGQVVVFTSIAEAEAHGGLTATAQETLRRAEQTALRLPPQPVLSSKNKLSRYPAHYRSDAYREIFSVVLRAHDLGTARHIAELWNRTGINSDYENVEAWLKAGETEEAITFARSIQSTPESARMQFAIAQYLLDQAGAPNI